MTRRRRIVISTVMLAVASAVVGVIVLASRPTSSAMAGMDHGSGATHESSHSTTSSGDMPGMDMPESTPTPTMAQDMPGMDHGSGAMAESTPTPTMAQDMPGMDHGSGATPESGHGTGDTVEASADRPLAPVLGAFGGGTSAVLITAGFLRRRDRAAGRVKEAARAARRSQK